MESPSLVEMSKHQRHISVGNCAGSCPFTAIICIKIKEVTAFSSTPSGWVPVGLVQSQV